MMNRLRAVTWALLAATLALAGCQGYTHDYATPLGAEDVKTVAIHMFKNKTLYTGIEFEFTAALQHEISAKTKLTVADRGDADSEITGSIDAYERVVLRKSRITDNVTRYSIVLTASYEFTRLPKDGRPTQLISSGKKVQRSVEYEVLSNTTEADARAEAVRKLARKFVATIFETW